MANQAPILLPYLSRQLGNMNTMKGVVSDGGNTFLRQSFVYISGGNLTLVASQGVLVYGQTPNPSQLSTSYAPVTLYGQNHWCFSPLDAEFDINCGALSGGATGSLVIGSSSQPQSAAVIGTSYGIATATTGTYAGYQFLDTTNTTQLLFTVVGYPARTATTDYNGRVIVRVITSCIQG